jgi:hypothetical protein
MMQQTLPWPPKTGNHVRIRGTRLLGTVVRIDGEGEAQRFTLAVSAPPDPDPGAAYELAQAARAVRTTYTLRELEPRSETV